jgi:hypothetical protein
VLAAPIALLVLAHATHATTVPRELIKLHCPSAFSQQTTRSSDATKVLSMLTGWLLLARTCGGRDFPRGHVVASANGKSWNSVGAVLRRRPTQKCGIPLEPCCGVGNPCLLV